MRPPASPAPSATWFLAEGATGSYFTTFVLLANPNAQPADVTVRYLPESGAPVTRTYTLGAQQRLTVNIANEDPTLANAAVATEVTATLPVVAERAQYWPGLAWEEAHASAGVTATATRWGLADGQVGGPQNHQTYILLANPGTDDATVTLTFLRPTGETITRFFDVPAASRRNVSIAGPASDVPELINASFGARHRVHPADRGRTVDVFRRRRNGLGRGHERHGDAAAAAAECICSASR